MGEEKRLLELLNDKHRVKVQVEIHYNFHQEQYEYSVVNTAAPTNPGG
jgi:hypothetical protein